MIKYGDQYILIDKGETFAGNWEQLADCLGLDESTLEGWCETMHSTFSISRYETKDELINSLYKLIKELNVGNDWVDGNFEEYSGGIDVGMEYSAKKIDELIKHFVENTY